MGVTERVAEPDPDRDDVTVGQPAVSEQLIERDPADELGYQVRASSSAPAS